MQELMKTIDSILQNPYTYLENLSRSKPIMGYSCTYAPVELIYASGYHPARIIGLANNVSLSDVYLQSYACAVVRTLLEDSLLKKLDFLSAFLFLHTCDSMQRLSDIFRINLNFKQFDLILPVKFSSQTSKDYFLDILNDFKSKLEQDQNIKIGIDSLNKAIQTYNDLKANLLKLYNIKSNNPEALSYSDLSKIVRTSFIMDPVEFINISSQIINKISQNQHQYSKRLMIIGSICNHPVLFETIENRNAHIVWDDLCTGTRFFDELTQIGDNPLQSIADRFIKRPICPTKHINPQYRLDYLKRKIDEYKINGVIFLFIKFCEPHAFDYPDQKNLLEKIGIPSIMVEIENHNIFDEQTRTRLETFIEMLGE
ncbi:MAG TPA: 2-hydroxyacyl-CoA dehydratase [Desulfurella acetivorans]|nr:2-hydroxyacyl-CoA dehydratase [Desulfurella acetivorans]